MTGRTRDNMILSFSGYAREQYAQVCGAREALLAYCQSLAPAHLLATHPDFGWGGSIRNLLVHNANAYYYWLGKQALQLDLEFIPEEDIPDMPSIRQLYARVDRMMTDFLEQYGQQGHPGVLVNRKGRTYTVDALHVFTHVITHEFHHKGQILTMSRILGNTPVDTDILRDPLPGN